MVEFQQLLASGMAAFVDVHFAVQIKSLNQGVSHGHSFGFHWMVLVIEELSHIVVVEIAYFTE